MRTPVIIATALLAVAATASPAAADKPERPVPPSPEEVQMFEDLCGGTLTVAVVKDTVKVKSVADGSGFTRTFAGNFVLQIALDRGEPIIVRTPGRAVVTGNADTIIVESIGRTLLLPPNPVAVAAHVEAGLPEVALVTGRTVITSTLDENGIPVDDDISYTGRVTDVCGLFV